MINGSTKHRLFIVPGESISLINVSKKFLPMLWPNISAVKGGIELKLLYLFIKWPN